MNVNWFKNPNNVIYTDAKEFVSYYAEEMGIPDLETEIKKFRVKPKEDGKILRGRNRVTIMLLVPKLVFEERFEQDENVWIYMGESYPGYCLCKREPWWGKDYSFFSHKSCEYFPCHEAADREDFNCLFCYCPLYPLKDRCGGNFKYLGNLKDCSDCTLPHHKRNYGYIMRRFSEIMAVSKPDS